MSVRKENQNMDTNLKHNLNRLSHAGKEIINKVKGTSNKVTDDTELKEFQNALQKFTDQINATSILGIKIINRIILRQADKLPDKIFEECMKKVCSKGATLSSTRRWYKMNINNLRKYSKDYCTPNGSKAKKLNRAEILSQTADFAIVHKCINESLKAFKKAFLMQPRWCSTKSRLAHSTPQFLKLENKLNEINAECNEGEKIMKAQIYLSNHHIPKTAVQFAYEVGKILL